MGHGVITGINIMDVFISSRPWRCLHVYQVSSSSFSHITFINHHGHAIALIPIHTIIVITWCIVNVIIKMMIFQTQLFCLAYSLSSLVTVEEEGNSEVQHPSKQSYLNFFSPFRSSAYIWKFRAPPSTSPTPTLFCRQSPRTPSSPSSASCSSSPSSTSSLSSSTSFVAPWSR